MNDQRKPSDDPFPPSCFDRLDGTDDPGFYRDPRKTVHLDDGAIAALRTFYGGVLPGGGRVLDLMSSWRSHLPEEGRYVRVVGVGLNAEEMSENPALHDYHVQDLNRDPILRFADVAFDAAVVSVSVQYMTEPVALFGEVGRVLAPGGPFCVAFSDRCFWEKAIRMWRETDQEGHVGIVRRYFELSGVFDAPEVVRRKVTPDREGDPLFVVWARGRTK